MSDQSEKKAFEQFAKAEDMNLEAHPHHYLFLDPVTAGARKAWKEAIYFCSRTLMESASGEISDDLPPLRSRIKYRRGDAKKWNKGQVIAHDEGKAVIRTRVGHYRALSPDDAEFVIEDQPIQPNRSGSDE